jgi:hypothetical protein
MIQLMEVPIIDKKAGKYLRKLNKKHVVDIVTARRESDREFLLEKFKTMKIREDKEYEKLIIVPYRPYEGKIHLAYDLYIDDSPNLAKVMGLYFQTKYMLLFNQPWNGRTWPGANIERIYGWKNVPLGVKNCLHYLNKK